MSSWFACDAPRFAAKYLDAQISFGAEKETKKGQARLYAVEMDASSKQPMILVNAIAEELSCENTNVGEFLAREYWTATQRWRFWEYTGSQITVLEELPWPDFMDLAIALQAYSLDLSLLKQLRAGIKT